MFFAVSNAIIVILCIAGVLPIGGLGGLFTAMLFLGTMVIQNDIDAMRK